MHKTVSHVENHTSLWSWNPQRSPFIWGRLRNVNSFVFKVVISVSNDTSSLTGNVQNEIERQVLIPVWPYMGYGCRHEYIGVFH